MGHGIEIHFDTLHDGHTQLLVSHFASTKLQLDFDFVALVEEFLGMLDLGHVVVLVDVDAKFHLFEFGGMGFFVLLLLGQLVTVFTEIDDAADGRFRIRRNFNKVEPHFFRAAKRVLQFEDAELFVRSPVDDAHLAGADAVIDPDGGRLWSAIKSQADVDNMVP